MADPSTTEKTALDGNSISKSPSPAVVSTGRLKISFRGNVLKTVTTSPAPTSTAPTPTDTPAQQRLEPPYPSTTLRTPSPHPLPPKPSSQETLVNDSSALEAAHKAELTKRARNFLKNLLATKEDKVEFSLADTPTTSQNTSHRYLNPSDSGSKLQPEDSQEALLMVAALSALGRSEAVKILLPTSQHAQSSTSDNMMQVTESSSTFEEHQRSNSIETSSTTTANPFKMKVTTVEAKIARQAARSARAAAAAASTKWDEDDESLALELELEFTQLDPQTRVELLKQIDIADHEQFIASGSRDERMAKAAREAAFHNVQLSFDRSRLGPYYFDPHTRTHQAFHSLSIPEPLCDATAAHPENPNLTIIHPDMPLPNGFSYFKQSANDFHPSLMSKLNNNPHVQLQPSLSLSTSLGGSSSISLSGSRPSIKVLLKPKSSSTIADPSSMPDNGDPSTCGTPFAPGRSSTPARDSTTSLDNEYRYAIMDGYVQWLKKELESHWTAAAPLSPHDTWSRQFRHQWEVLQPQGAFDYVPLESGQKSNQLGHSTLLTPAAGGGRPASVSAAIRKVWKEHKIHLQAEHAVQLAMEGAERTKKRGRFGDPTDLDIDPSKPLTRDERRKLAKREKEYPKLMSMFLAQGLIGPDEFDLKKLSWYDFHSLFQALDISVAHLLEEEAAKNQLPAIIVGPNGQVKARSHKKGAARAARLAAKKAAMEAEAAAIAANAGNASLPDLSVASASRKRSHDDISTGESSHFQQRSSQMRAINASSPVQVAPGPRTERCATCGVSDKDDFVHCSSCRNSYHLFCLDEDVELNDLRWVCPSCRGAGKS